MRGGARGSWIKISRQGGYDPENPEGPGGEQDELLGDWTPPPVDPTAPPGPLTPEGARILYDGPCLWQDTGPETRRSRDGAEQVLDSDGRAYLPRSTKARRAVEEMRTGDTCEVTPIRGRPRVLQGQAQQVRLMDLRILVKQVTGVVA